MRIGIIGAGHIGGTLAKLFVDAGHEVAVSTSRGPETLVSLVEELGGRAQAMTAAEAERFGEVVIVSVPFGRYRELPTQAVAGNAVIDTNNYYPQRDGHFEEIDSDRTTSSELLNAHLSDARVVKEFNAIQWMRLRDDGRPAGDPEQLGIPISGDASPPEQKDAVPGVLGRPAWARRSPDADIRAIAAEAAHVANTGRLAVESACSQRKDHVPTWLWIVIIVIVVLAILGYFGRGRFSR